MLSNAHSSGTYATPDIDYILIETTGIAEMIALMMIFLSTSLGDVTFLDSMITVVDEPIPLI
ncbi:MAG: hypothetical protein HRU34_09245 [Richelia sp.]|nr:hypothetical protein [Richelia sp.]